MRIVVNADAQQKEEFLSKGVPADVTVSWSSGATAMPGADAYFDLLFEDDGPAFREITGKPVFVNAVISTCQTLPANYIRINAWSGFLQRACIELAVADRAALVDIDPILNAIGWKYQPVPDTPGMIAPRVIAMIINEAYFGLGEGISSKAAIDTAMKLGTNYPYGPFEWSEKIGLQKISRLLKKLHETDSRYTVAPALEKDLNNKPIAE
jgi:3-hydroxybutyryl-CoA dehydrogenase